MDGVTDLDGTSLSTFDDFLDMLRGGTDCSVSELNHSGVEIEDTLEDNLAVEGEPWPNIFIRMEVLANEKKIVLILGTTHLFSQKQLPGSGFVENSSYNFSPTFSCSQFFLYIFFIV